MKYLFQLGNHPELSRAEIEHVFDFTVHDVQFTGSRKWMMIESTQPLDAEALIHRLGGTISIAEAVTKVGDPIFTIANYLDEEVTDKIFFSLHTNNPKKLAISIKKELKARGRSVRYIEAGNTATILHNNLVKRKGDLTIIGDTLFVTRAIQPIEAFGERDYGRPERDSKSGMVPPKLAQILINLSGTKQDDVLLDPFCGSGTILMEAALMGYTRIIGSDSSVKAVKDTRKNLEWLAKDQQKITMKQCDNIALHERDVRGLTTDFLGTKIDAIVTEPFMGKPKKGNERRDAVRAEARELAELYINAFAVFKQILSPSGVVVCVIPQFNHDGEWLYVPCLEQIKKHGFTMSNLTEHTPSILYHRAGQHVGRMVYRFVRNS